jgi:hypothetical protein
VAAALGARREHDGDALLHRLEAWADDVAVDDPGDALLLKASFLVARDRIDAFEHELESAAREQAPRLLIDSLGPLPPTAFAALDDR